MGWRIRDSGGDPPFYDHTSGYFTIKMLIGGWFEGPTYLGGMVGWVDYCHKDELSIIELYHMAKELGHSSCNDYYFKLNGEKRIVKCDQDVMGLSYLVDCDMVAQVYCVSTMTDVVATQGSHIGNFSGGASKTKSNVVNTITGKDNVMGSGLVNVQVDNDEESDEYDPDSTSSESDSDDEEFYESDDGVDDDDDTLIPQEYASVVDGLTNLDGDSDEISSDDLRSLSGSSSDEDGGTGRKKAKTKHTVFNEKTDMANPIFKVGMEFKSHEQVREAIKEYSIKWGKKIKFHKNDKAKVDAVCKTGCPWHIYASYIKNEGVYKVKTYVDEHNCTREFNIPWVNTKWIIRTYYDRIRRNPTWPIPSLAETIEAEWTVHVDRQKVFRAKRKALQLIEGTAAQQFGQLYGYIEEVKSTNPGTTFIMKVKPVTGSESDVKFKRLYICWGALKKGFMEGCRPVIGLDGCHLKGPHGGIMLTAVGIDANNCIYPFAYAVVEKEKRKTWLWFLELLKTDLGIMNSHTYTFMTDKQKGLIDAVAQLFPNASHRFCVRHLYNNFKGEFKGLVLKEILWKAARATTMPAFTKAMEEMKAVEPRAYQWLNERPAIHWSRSHFNTFPKCDILLNNLCESFNSVILSARDKPIISMLERIRIILIETIQKRHFQMSRSNNTVCPKIMKMIAKLKEYKGWIPRYSGDGQFEVVGPNNEQYRIHLGNKTCGCRRWELSGIPCVHAIAGYNHLDRDMVDYIHECYKVNTYLATYSNFLTPINGKDFWPNEGYPTLLPPDVKKRVGRPKKARRREPEENPNPTKLSKRGMKMSCSNCGKIGHNKRGCKQAKRGLANQSAVNAEASQGAVIAPANQSAVNAPTGTRRRGKLHIKRPATLSKGTQGSSVSKGSNVTKSSYVSKEPTVSKDNNFTKGTSLSRGSTVTNIVQVSRDVCGQSTSKQSPPPIRTKK